MPMPLESALVALIPEAESLVETFRSRYDPSAAIGMPAHVTLLYPFKPFSELTDETIATLRAIFATMPSFAVSFSEIQRFSDVLYLAPDPAQPFRNLIEIVIARFPETPPYGGVFAEVIPHFTIAQLSDNQQLEEIAAAFHEAAKGKLPVRAKIDAITLMDNSGGRWHVQTTFALQPGNKPAYPRFLMTEGDLAP